MPIALQNASSVEGEPLVLVNVDSPKNTKRTMTNELSILIQSMCDAVRDGVCLRVQGAKRKR